MVPPLDRTWMIGIWPVDVYQIPIIIGISSGVLLLLLFIAVLVAWRCCHFQRLREKAFGTKLITSSYQQTGGTHFVDWMSLTFLFFFFLLPSSDQCRGPDACDPFAIHWQVRILVPFQLIRKQKPNRENLLQILFNFYQLPISFGHVNVAFQTSQSVVNSNAQPIGIEFLRVGPSHDRDPNDYHGWYFSLDDI